MYNVHIPLAKAKWFPIFKEFLSIISHPLQSTWLIVLKENLHWFISCSRPLKCDLCTVTEWVLLKLKNWNGPHKALQQKISFPHKCLSQNDTHHPSRSLRLLDLVPFNGVTFGHSAVFHYQCYVGVMALQKLKGQMKCYLFFERM